MNTPIDIDPIDRVTLGGFATAAGAQADASIFSPRCPGPVAFGGDGFALDARTQRLVRSPRLVVSSTVLARDGVMGSLTAIGSPDELLLGRVSGERFVVTGITSVPALALSLAEQCVGGWTRSANERQRTAYVWLAGVVVDGDRVIEGADLSAFPPPLSTLEADDLGADAVAELTPTFELCLRGVAASSRAWSVASETETEDALEQDDELLRISAVAAFELTLVAGGVAATIVSGPGGTLTLSVVDGAESVSASRRGLVGELGHQLNLVRAGLPVEAEVPVVLHLRTRPDVVPDLALVAEVAVSSEGSVLTFVQRGGEPDVATDDWVASPDSDRAALGLVAGAVVEAMHLAAGTAVA